MANKTVCIEREYGSNGKKIAEWLSRSTGIECYDKAALKEIALKNGLVPEETAGAAGAEGAVDEEAVDHKCYSEAIKFLSEKRSCIFVGTCASSILQDRKRNLNVFIKADMESKIRWAMASEKMDEEQARQFISDMDGKRKEYRSNYSETESGEPVVYDLVVTSSKFGIEGTAELIRSCLSRI